MKYQCGVCGYTFDESSSAYTWDTLPEGWSCPICDAAQVFFKQLPEEDSQPAKPTTAPPPSTIQSEPVHDLSYPSGFQRNEDAIERHMDIIHSMAQSGRSVIEPMRSRLPQVSWDDILILGAQLAVQPLAEDHPIQTQTIIGPHAKQPLIMDHPVFISHMSFGALSREMKLSLAKGSAMVHTAMCSGEGGILPESMEAAYKYIFEYVPNRYSVTPDILQSVDAIEIKIGQGSKPGMGGHLPGEKVTEEIAAIRNKPIGEDIISPSTFSEIQSKDDLKAMVDMLREQSNGRPIGIKIAAGHIESDLEVIAYAQPDFITIDGRAGGSGASPKIIKDTTTLPTIYALHRAREYMDQHQMTQSLIITGGLRVSSDFAKALAMGADAIAIATAAMMAGVCQQYRICESGKCPVGCATQDSELRKRLHGDHTANRVANYLQASLEEMKTFARITGKDDVHQLNTHDLVTINRNISDYTHIQHA